VLEGANPYKVSDRANERGRDQVGTLGSGNHFVEINVVEKIYDEKIASAFGLIEGNISILIHTGSRGFGYQICDDYLVKLKNEQHRFGAMPPDKQLAYAPVNSDLGRDYYGAMVCAVNYARANRQVIMHLVRNSFEKYFKIGFSKMEMYTVYDIAHNIARFEEHKINGVIKNFVFIEKELPELFLLIINM